MIFKKPIYVNVSKWSLLPPPPYSGITIYPFVIISYSRAMSHKWFTWSWLHKLIRHETIHFFQMQKEGLIKFYIKYMYYTIRYGYDNNPYEIEAYKEQEAYGHLPITLEVAVKEEYDKWNS